MPMLIPVVAAYAVSTAVTAVIGTSIFAGVLAAVAGAAAAAFVSKMMADGRSPQGANVARGMLIDATQSYGPIPVLYGSRRCGGLRTVTEVSNGAATAPAAATLVINGASLTFTVPALGGGFVADIAVTPFTVLDPAVGSPTYGVPFTRVASNPAAMQYAVDANGTYTFNAADAGTSVSIAYQFRPLGAVNAVLNVVIVWCEGQIAGIDQIYLDDVPITDGRFTGRYYYENYLGTDTQAASAALIAAMAGKWTANDTNSGFAYTYLQLYWDPDVFPRGMPVVTADLRGELVVDPRDGTTKYSDNPALCIRDYLTNARYGWAADSSMIDDASFKDVAYYCDQQVSIPTATGTTTQARYVCRGLVDVDQKIIDNLNQLLTSCRGFLVFSGGQYKLRLDRGQYALQFDGSTQRISVPVASSSSLDIDANPITLEAWVSPSANQASAIVGRGVSGSNGYALGFFINAAAKFNLGANGGGNFDGATIITLGQRYHVVGVINGASSVLYVNGAQDGTGSVSVVASTRDLLIGANDSVSPNRFFPGTIDAVRIYNRALSGPEVAEHYRGVYRNESGLVGRWEFDEGQGTTAYDWSGNGNNGTLVNGPSYVAQLPGSASVFTLNEDNIVGGWKIALPQKRTRFNRVKAQFIDAANLWQPNVALESSATYLADDGNEILEAQIDLPFTPDVYRAHQIAMQVLKQSRSGIGVTLTATIAATQLEVGDVVPLTHSSPGWTSKYFRVENVKLLSSDEVQLALSEYDANVYSLSALSYVEPAPSTNLPDPSAVGAPGTPSVTEVLYQTSGSAGVKSKATVAWAASADLAVQSGGRYEVQYQLVGAMSWTVAANVTASVLSQDVLDLGAGSYNFRVVAFNTAGRSAPSQIVTKQLIGLSAPPSDLTSFTVQSYSGQAKFTWDKLTSASDLDVLIGGRIFVRWTPKTVSASWEDGSLVNPDGYPGDTSIGFGPLMTGTYLAKARDSSGNFSVNAASFVVTEAILTGFTTVASVTESPGFPGTKTNLAAVDNVLELSGSTLWDSIPGNIDDWLENVDTQGGVQLSGSYSFSQKLDCGSVQAVRLFSTIDSTAFDALDQWDSRTENIDDWGVVDGAVIEDCEVQLYVRATNDDPNGGSPAWGPWHPLGLVGDYSARGFDFRLDFTNGDPSHNRQVATLSVAAKH